VRGGGLKLSVNRFGLKITFVTVIYFFNLKTSLGISTKQWFPTTPSHQN
jgi:hypothetical protein